MDKSYKDKAISLLLFAIALFIALCLFSFEETDISFFTSQPNSPCQNYGGIVGAYLSFFLLSALGFSAYLIPLVCLLLGIDRSKRDFSQKGSSLFFQAIALLIFLVCLSSVLGGESNIRKGGILGVYLFSNLSRYFGNGTYIIIAIFLILSFLLIKDILQLPFLLKIVKKAGGLLVRGLVRLTAKIRKRKEERVKTIPIREKKTKRPRIKISPEPSFKKRVTENLSKKQLPEREELPASPKPASSRRRQSEQVEVEPIQEDEPHTLAYQLPPLSLLKSPPPLKQRKIKDDLEANARILEGTLLDFGVEAKVTNIDRGPTITRYELLPAPGVKINKIVTLADNIALAMKAGSVRFITPIPGKAAVGLEIPNSSTALVYCREILSSEQFRESNFIIPLGLGKDVSGMPLIADLGEMPHLLIAGTTGSGKTVCVNNLIINLLFKFSPDELKLLIIDPKMVELASFNDIPHLLCPAITQAKKAGLALNWAVGEMERRFQLLAGVGMRNIKVYNQKLGENSKDALPYIIIVVDELADLMMVAPKEVEGAITRLAQLSRAVGIHIILATQRPSVDVITGVIKANFPARISFKVASKVDSRTVLDVNGADKLLGNGDMLFLQPGSAKPIRAQGTLVFDEEIERVVSFLKKQRRPVYNEEILKKETKEGRVSLEKDELYEEAVRLVLETRHASVSLLQRRLGLGYSRAARIIDMMEEEGIVGPLQGSKPREILKEVEPPEAGRE